MSHETGFIERKTMTWAKLEAAEYIRDNLPGEARLAMYDSGITSYFSRRDFVGLNGVIGDYALADLIMANRYEEVARNYGVQYLVLDIDPSMHDALPGREVFRGSIMSSRPEEPPLQPLTEPDVNLSIHPAPANHPSEASRPQTYTEKRRSSWLYAS
jgi:hypothetical protein